MKILYILGNGFDLSLDIKTSYTDFYNYYKLIESTNENVNKLKKEISINYKNWSDLEFSLGQYTQELKTVKEFDEVFDDIGEHLAEYLKKEEDKFDPKKINREKFFKDLVRVEEYLPTADRNILNAYKNKFLSSTWNIEIFTFNYTRTIEKIIGEKRNVEIGHHPNGTASVILKGVEHIHGYVDKRMVLGINDISQLKNKEFHNNVDILEAIVKEKCNKAYRHTIDDLFTTKIKQANLICIFGSSIGDTDNMWWEQIGQKLINEIPIIIFSKGEEVISARNGYKNNRTERKIRQYFLKKTKLTDEEKEKFGNNVFVVLDSPIFKEI
ncbi:hypothetical protein A7A78_06275 [Aequorivita soesokkakensis]|uniref:Bacteriophage abortive infection AbiH n=1 Tax=Aequorivita soesokkakensis TaxID=1385699 RepID=A0A1A9LDR1_9FLAO|nr:bacteriophage abortive infection AbiH family protein [Aequorivita soesokkakensis]OAD90515.1 hypothetical protein A7A78_06275 [Aequorivita soesokkakensis]